MQNFQRRLLKKVDLTGFLEYTQFYIGFHTPFRLKMKGLNFTNFKKNNNCSIWKLS
ncbi:hypothetical protein HMPREF0061_1061 [Aerococcus viridans ATCC 11563 = CCUG 4311]|uniref:Uncharacterized protein n=1 Tax=Aerococcus viridans (strain ATCC 11563 / DSM 20340 / CCUG 4311 / JCM 20461 / NBRC 12219 / NCTC 8251 / M1) TaxID=655812 RepID=A0ABP2I6Q8_AERVM|nr:hypothetical protein HMPREF0061_1061 [Aerococcus viridans ATCC 11563 = CCUG 4311]